MASKTHYSESNADAKPSDAKTVKNAPENLDSCQVSRLVLFVIVVAVGPQLCLFRCLLWVLFLELLVELSPFDLLALHSDCLYVLLVIELPTDGVEDEVDLQVEWVLEDLV